MKCLVFLVFFVVSAAGIDLSGRTDIQRRTIGEGDTLKLVCKATPAHLRSYRWVYIREGSTKPRVISSGRRLTVGEPRFRLHAQKKGEFIELTLQLREIRPYETGIFMCWKQNHKPDPQVYVKVLEQGFTEAQPASVEISGPTHTSYGNTVTIKCFIRPSVPGGVTWWRNGRQIDPRDNSYVQSVEETKGEMVASLTIGTAREAANYTCKSLNRPPAEASFHLLVRVANVDLLIAEPPTTLIQYGEKLSLTCVVSGSDQEILWMKDGSFLAIDENHSIMYKNSNVVGQGKQQSTLIIQTFSWTNNGQYACYVPGASKDIFINIEGRSPHLIGLEGWDFIEGEVLRLTCTTQYAKDNMDVQWLFNGAPLDQSWWVEHVSRAGIHNMTHHDLSIPVPISEQAGTYTCLTPFGNDSSTVHQLVLPYVKKSPPPQVDVGQGEKLVLPCSIAGYPGPIVFWEKFINNQWKMVEEAKSEGEYEMTGIQIDTTDVTNPVSPVFEQRQDLIFEEALEFHAGQYQCRGTSDKGAVLVTTLITVQEPPPVILGMTADPVTEGEDLIITCSVINSRRQVDFVYGIAAIDLSGDFKYSITSYLEPSSMLPGENRNVRTFVLTVANATLQDHGLYECHADDEVFDIINAIVKLPPPRIIEMSSSPAVEENELFISCTIENARLDREVVFSFHHENLNRSSSRRYSVHLAEAISEQEAEGERTAKQATYVLKIKKLKMEDSGEYFCSLDFDGHEKAVDSLRVEVEAKKLLKEEVRLEIEVGDDIYLRCITDNWEEEVTFFHNSTVIDENLFQRYMIGREPIGQTSYVHTLQIRTATPEDAGRYQCFTSPFVFDDVNVTAEELGFLEPTQKESSMPIYKEEPVYRELHFVQLPEDQFGLSIQCETIEEFNEIIIECDGVIPAVSHIFHNPDLAVYQNDVSIPKDGSKLLYENSIYGLKYRRTDRENIKSCTCRSQNGKRDIWDTIVFKDSEPLQFSERPRSTIRVERGRHLSMTCSATGFPEPNIVWYKKDSSVPLMNSWKTATLEIPPVTEEDVGAYICSASTNNDIIVSGTKVAIGVVEIEDSFGSETFVPEFSKVDIKCLAHGSETPQISWYKKDDEFKILSVGEDYAFLSIREFNLEDAGIYTCEASILGATVTKDTELIMAAKTSVQPSTSPSPTLLLGRLVELYGPTNVEVQGSVTFMCLVSPLLNHFDVQVLHEDTVLVDEEELVSDGTERLRLVTGKGGVGERLLNITIHNIEYEDSGFYECRVNSSPRAQHSHYLNVVPEGSLPTHATTLGTAPPSSTVHQTSQITTLPPRRVTSSNAVIEILDIPMEVSSAYVGETVELQCQWIPEKTTRVSWSRISKTERAVLFADGFQITDDPRFRLLRDSSHRKNILRIESLRQNDTGLYKCQSLEDPSLSFKVQLTVLDRAAVTPWPYPSESLDEKIEEELRKIYEEEELEEDEEKKVPEEPYLESQEIEEPIVIEDVEAYDYTEPEEQDVAEDEVLGEHDVEGDRQQTADYDEEMEKSENTPEDEPPHISPTDLLEETPDEGAEPDLDAISPGSTNDAIHHDVDEKKLTEDSEPIETDGELETSKEEVTDDIEDTEDTDEEYDTVALSYEDSDALGSSESSEDLEENNEVVPVSLDYTEVKHEQKNETIDNTETPRLPDDSFTDIEETENQSHHISTSPVVTTKPIRIDIGTTQASLDTTRDYNEISDPKEIPIPQLSEDSISQETTTFSPRVTSHESSSDVPSVPTTQVPLVVVTETLTTMKAVSSTDSVLTTSSTEKARDASTSTTRESSPVTTEENIIFGSTATPFKITSAPSTTESVTQTTLAPKPQQTTRTTTEYSKLSPGIENELDWVPEDTLEYTNVSVTEEDYETDFEYPVIIGDPEGTTSAPIDSIVILPCETDSTPEDITWKAEDEILFLGSLDLAGVVGLQLSVEGNLKLLPGNKKIKDGITYTCYIYDYKTFGDVPLHSYKIEFDRQSSFVHDGELDFPELDMNNIAIVSNSNVSAEGLAESFKNFGINVKLVNTKDCNFSSILEGWSQAKEFMKKYCEPKLLEMNDFHDTAIFFILDFLVKLPLGGSYGSTLLHVNNIPKSTSTHVFGPLVPVYSGQTPTEIQCGTPVYEDTDDVTVDYCTNVASTMLIALQESYSSEMNL